MIISLISVIGGFILLAWSADRFVEGSAVSAKHLGISPLLIGMIVVGFGTSAPEMLVSAISAYGGNPGIAMGNAYGSNICNIALILGLAALISPIYVKSNILKKELPVLTGVTLVSIALLANGFLTRPEAGLLMAIFFILLAWSIWQQKASLKDPLEDAVEHQMEVPSIPMKKALFYLISGLAVLIASSRVLVSGAVDIARFFGISDLLIGLTIVAIGTSLPELAAALSAARKNEHDIALGNIIGSNLFNTLGVVGIAGLIHPMAVDPAVLSRDVPVMTGLTVSLFIIGYGFFGRPGRINRYEGALLLSTYVSYNAWLIYSQFHSASV